MRRKVLIFRLKRQVLGEDNGEVEGKEDIYIEINQTLYKYIYTHMHFLAVLVKYAMHDYLHICISIVDEKIN